MFCAKRLRRVFSKSKKFFEALAYGSKMSFSVQRIFRLALALRPLQSVDNDPIQPCPLFLNINEKGVYIGRSECFERTADSGGHTRVFIRRPYRQFHGRRHNRCP